ncbi:LPXTG cell wall anchor domain-containing protein [Streptococcus didelphis]|uniref:LPXTG cell wall anchor domain-containing protein n=1 Tax=Streptococcus didelphis TaxID=102886 RepID=UPI0027D25C47|nr:LPXTG cell wall anchor domain-containing protein [Streptococcus didelphis]WMB29081.1 LPXTG cell wall anchor domain-containing protein [Streptococcus didelphis]
MTSSSAKTQAPAAQAKANQLPATGDQKNPFFTAAAMALIAGAGSLSLLPKVKKGSKLTKLLSRNRHFNS